MMASFALGCGTAYVGAIHGETRAVKKITVEVRDDHLELLSRAKPMAAVAELIWNALDADATEVRVEFIENELGGEDVIRISDNGHGLHYGHALVVFKNLGGSWKQEGMQTANRKRLLHGQYGKGRFRAFALGNRVEWQTVYDDDHARYAYGILGHAATLGEFELTDPVLAGTAAPGMVVEVTDLPRSVGLLRGGKALDEVTDLFAPYLRQYPGVRIVYDGTPLDPSHAEDRVTDHELDEIVTQNGDRVHAALTIVEWNLPGKRGLVLCDANGFALHPVKRRLLFRGFSYTAYLKSAHFSALEREGLLQLAEMTPDVVQVLDLARTRLRQHFALREAERAQDVIEQWKETGLYPYDGQPAGSDEETERLIFNIYASHLNQLTAFAGTPHANKRLILRLLQELVHAEPTRVARVLDELLAFPEDKQAEVLDLLET